MKKNELKQIIREELIRESFMSNILSFLAGYITKGSGDPATAQKAINEPDVQKAVKDYADSHNRFVQTLSSFEKKYGVNFPEYLKNPLHKK